MPKKTFRVEGMTCSACVAHVTKSVEAIEGVLSVGVNLFAGSMLVEYNAPATDIKIIDAVNKAGYHASLEEQGDFTKKKDAKTRAHEQDEQRNREIAQLKRRFFLSPSATGKSGRKRNCFFRLYFTVNAENRDFSRRFV